MQPHFILLLFDNIHADHQNHRQIDVLPNLYYQVQIFHKNHQFKHIL